MQISHVIRAIGQPALARFLDARAKGAAPDLLAKLADEAMAEQESELAKAQRVRLIVSNEKPTPDLAS
jgi:hypothetical protein